jgi:hypothetical protein
MTSHQSWIPWCCLLRHWLWVAATREHAGRKFADEFVSIMADTSHNRCRPKGNQKSGKRAVAFRYNKTIRFSLTERENKNRQYHLVAMP